MSAQHILPTIKDRLSKSGDLLVTSVPEPKTRTFELHSEGVKTFTSIRRAACALTYFSIVSSSADSATLEFFLMHSFNVVSTSCTWSDTQPHQGCAVENPTAYTLEHWCPHVDGVTCQLHVAENRSHTDSTHVLSQHDETPHVIRRNSTTYTQFCFVALTLHPDIGA